MRDHMEDEPPSQGLELRGYIDILRRRWLLIAAPVALLTPLAAAIALVLPPVYSANARLLVESQQIPRELAQSTVTAGVAERIALIEQRLMTRQNLLDLAARFRIWVDRSDLSPSDIVELMRAATRIEGVSLTGGRGPVTAVNISFRANRPVVAADVANELMTLLLQQNIQQRSDRASETSSYFRAEVERLSRALRAVEDEVAAFKNQNSGALPDSLSFRRDELSRLQERSFERELRGVVLSEQRASIQRAAERGDFSAAGTAATPEQQELDRLRRSLVQQRSLYAETHPTIRATLARITSLERSVAAQVGGVTADGAPGQVARAIEAIEAEERLLAERSASERARIKELEASIDRTPEVERTLSELERRRANLTAQYQDSLLKQAQAETGERLEINQQAERFEVVEQAQPPASPESPNRALIVVAGAAGSLFVGLGAALLAELLNRSIRTAADMERRLQLRPIVTIPYIRTPRESFWRRWRARTLLLFLILLAPAALYAIDQYYQPLPLAFERALEKLGVDRLLTLFQNRFGG